MAVPTLPPPSSIAPSSAGLAPIRAALHELPLFPLPQAVLFPGALMPLHVFEQRYRQMVRDALDSHKALAIAHVIEGPTDEHGNPPIARVAGAGVIVEWQELPDGRYNLFLEGRARVHLTELPFVPPYRRARAELLEEKSTEIDSADSASLVAVANSFTAFVQARDPNFHFSLPPSLPAPRIADLCAHHLILDARERQTILEMLDAAERVRKVALSLAVQLAVLKREPRSTMN
jgi:ATP-dependent Lon protease